MLGQSVITKQLEEIKSKDRFLQVKTYFILAILQNPWPPVTKGVLD